jgi:hypothetical protein
VNQVMRRQLKHLIEAALEEGAKVTSSKSQDSAACLSLTYPSGETVWLFQTAGGNGRSAREKLLEVAEELIQEDGGDDTLST